MIIQVRICRHFRQISDNNSDDDEAAADPVIIYASVGGMLGISGLAYCMLKSKGPSKQLPRGAVIRPRKKLEAPDSVSFEEFMKM